MFIGQNDYLNVLVNTSAAKVNQQRILLWAYFLVRNFVYYGTVNSLSVFSLITLPIPLLHILETNLLL